MAVLLAQNQWGKATPVQIDGQDRSIHYVGNINMVQSASFECVIRPEVIRPEVIRPEVIRPEVDPMRLTDAKTQELTN